MIRYLCAMLVLLALSTFAAAPAMAQGGPSAAPTSTVDVHPLPLAAPAASFDPDKATNAYLARISGEARAKSDAYFEGGYWLVLFNTLYALGVAAILLFTRLSARLRRNAENMTRSRFWQAPVYIFQYLIVATILSFPIDVYTGFFREHQYGLSNQNFMEWFVEDLIDFGLTMVGGLIIGTLIYAVIRATKRFWWAWAAGVLVAFSVFGATIAPVYIAPLFNKYTPLPDSQIKRDVLSLGRSEGIPVDNVYMNDASKQSKRISANVSGMFGTTRITLNDNLLHRSTEREILAVLGHEMGHYVLDHSTRLLLMIGLVIFAAFGFTAWGFNVVNRVFGGLWDVRGVDDPAGAPLLLALFSFFFFLATPITNTISRTTEAQADIFGVNAARQPDGFAEAALQLSEYRKLDPTPLEEFVFFDHPSGRNRISMMMHWKAEHLNDPDIKAGPVSPQ